jgi:hypothetical protein
MTASQPTHLSRKRRKCAVLGTLERIFINRYKPDMTFRIIVLWAVVSFFLPALAKADMRGRAWLADGPTALYASGKNFFGNDFSAGGNFEFGPASRWTVGGEFDWLGTNEDTGDPVLGPVRRFTLMIKAGFYFVPDKLYLALKLGPSVLHYNRSQDLIWMMGGLEVGGNFLALSRHFELGAAFTYMHSPEVDAGHYYGDHNGQGTFPSRYISAANVYAIRLVLSFLMPPRN